MDTQSDRQIHTVRRQNVSECSATYFTQTKTCPAVFSVCMRYSTAAYFAWKVCPDDMMICSRKLTEHRAPEVPGPRRLLCKQPKAYLQADTSHTSVCLELLYIIMSSVTVGTETSKRWDSQRSTAFSSTKPQHIALQHWECETVLYLLEVCVVPQRQDE